MKQRTCYCENFNCEECFPSETFKKQSNIHLNHSWQQCPVCKGEGVKGFMKIRSLQFRCDVCNGKKIISKLTGQPPL